MSKTIFLSAIFLTLTSCFKTDIGSEALPFSYDDGEGRYDSSFIVEYNLSISLEESVLGSDKKLSLQIENRIEEMNVKIIKK